MQSTLINNQWLIGEGEELISLTPDEKKILWQKKSSSVSQVKKAIDVARQAQPSWEQTSLDERITIVKKYAQQLDKNKEEFAHIISLESGKTLWESQLEVNAMINKIDISIRAQQERAGTKEIKSHLQLSHRAHGVMAVFGPFNFPGHLPNGHIIPALLAGNSVVFKPSELTPLCAEYIAKIWLSAGLPAGVFNLVQGAKTIGEALVQGEINGILFTGSHTVGKKIHQQLAGKPEILLALEMGGNNAMIVGQTKDIALAAHTILHSAFLSAGQRCTCTRRLILVSSPQNDRLLSTLVGLCERVIVGSNEKTPFMGPVINKHIAQTLLHAQDKLIFQGAKTLTKMRAVDNSQVYLSPGILDVTDVKKLEDIEYFGPLLQVHYAQDIEHAIALANNTQFGLAAGLISNNPNEQEKFKKTIKAGVIAINQATAGASSELPFGGIGASGNHRPSAYYAADYCAWPQATTINLDSENTAIDMKKIRGLR